jgi:hypothetical protein
MVWFILLSILLLCNILATIYTGMLCANENRKLHLFFPFLTVYENLRESYNFIGSLIPTILCAICMIVHFIFMCAVTVVAFVAGIFEGIWFHLFRKR